MMKNDEMNGMYGIPTEFNQYAASAPQQPAAEQEKKEMKEKNDSNIIKIARLENDYQSAQERYSEAQSRLNKCKDAYRSYITSARGQGEIKPWWVQLPSYYGIEGPESF